MLSPGLPGQPGDPGLPGRPRQPGRPRRHPGGEEGQGGREGKDPSPRQRNPQSCDLEEGLERRREQGWGWDDDTWDKRSEEAK